jgi:hypothetical protein
VAIINVRTSGPALLFQLGVLEKGLQCSRRDGAAIVVVGHTIGKVELVFPCTKAKRGRRRCQMAVWHRGPVGDREYNCASALYPLVTKEGISHYEEKKESDDAVTF